MCISYKKKKKRRKLCRTSCILEQGKNKLKKKQSNNSRECTAK
jgi:hypothetical protein